MFDWTDALSRLRAHRRTPDDRRGCVRTLRPGQELVLVVSRSCARRAGARRGRSSCASAPCSGSARLDADPRVRREAVVPVFGFDRLPRGVRAVVYRRR